MRVEMVSRARGEMSAMRQKCSSVDGMCTSTVFRTSEGTGDDGRVDVEMWRNTQWDEIEQSKRKEGREDQGIKKGRRCPPPS